MRNAMRRSVVLIATIVAGLTLALSGSALAGNASGTGSADGSSSDNGSSSDEGSCAAGEAHGAGTAPLNSFRFHVCQNSADPTDASGYFEAAGTPPSDVLVAPKGPATCVDVRGDTAGFVYPVAEGSKPDAIVGMAILITARDGGPDGPDLIGFTGPLPPSAFGGQCAPTALGLLQPVTSGDITVTDRN